MSLQIRGSTYRIFKPRYIFDEGMAEISGMGGDYEQKCRTMLKAGLEWFDENPNADPKFTECEGIYGIFDIDNTDGEAISKAVLASVDGCSGAMHQVVLSSVIWIRKNGWDAYVDMMKKPKEKDQDEPIHHR